MSLKESYAAIRKSGVDGRGLFATKTIKAGELIFKKTRPLIGVLDNPRLGDTCAYCYRTSQSVVYGGSVEVKACTGCRRVGYCSKTCQTNHWKRSHKYICKKLTMSHADKLLRIPIMVYALLELIVLHDNGVISEDEWLAVLQLKSHAKEMEQTNPEMFKDAQMNASGARSFLNDPTPSSYDLHTQIMCAMLTNSFSIVAPTCDPLGMCFDPFASCANHSCDPNAFMIMDGPELSFRTLKAIGKDEEIFVSYIDNTEPYIHKQVELRRYFFACNCTKCASSSKDPEDGLLTPSPEVMVKLRRNVYETIASSGLSKSQWKAKLKKELPGGFTEIDDRIPQLMDLRTREIYEKVVSVEDPIQRTTGLENVMRMCKQSELYTLTRQPYPQVRHELILALIAQQKFSIAWLHAVKTYVQIDPILYPEPHNPLRVVHCFRLSKLCAYMASETSSTDRATVKQCAEMGMEITMLGWKCMKEAAENVKASHGEDSSFTKMVVATFQAAVNETRTLSPGFVNGLDQALMRLNAPLKDLAESLEY